MRKLKLALSAALLLSGCVADINQRNAAFYDRAGQAAENSGDFQQARQMYAKAVVNAELGGENEGWQSAYHYNYGRMMGVTCMPGEAEKYLLSSLALEEKARQKNSYEPGQLGARTQKGVNLYDLQRYFELARFYYDNDRMAASVTYYEKAVPLARHIDIEKSDPIAFANILDEFAIALKSTGELPMSMQVSEQAAQLRGDNPGKAALFVPLRYNSHCPEGVTPPKSW